jgi:choline kinase
MLTYLGATEVIVMCRVVDAAAIEAAYAAGGDLAPARVAEVTTTSGLETLLTAKDLIDSRPFLLSCVDSVIPQPQLTTMKSKIASVADGTFLVGCTPARHTCDGTSVLLERGEIIAIGKDLPPQPLITAGIYGCPDDFVYDLDHTAVTRLGHLGSYLGWYCETTNHGIPVVFRTCFDVDTVCDLHKAEAYLRGESEQ